MKPNQSLYDLTAAIIEEVQPVLEDYKPDYVLVHGDHYFYGGGLGSLKGWS